ncbi:ATP-binding protein [Shewanella sp. YIC-542]|uniref:sensor histidine kinase n=1 Tax=Shewanella mytili TaxID=3377111 RepID=UPI00398EFF53
MATFAQHATSSARLLAITGSALLMAYALDVWMQSSIAILLILQLAVALVALYLGARYAYVSAFIQALAFNFLFTHPRYTLQMQASEDMVNLLVFLLVAIITTKLSERYYLQQQNLRQEQLRNRILLSVSHDLRTPLSAIIGTLTTLKAYDQKLVSTEKDELLTSAISESHRLHQYIENLLHATKLQYGTLKCHKTEQSLVNIVKNMLSRFKEDRGRIAFDYPDNMPLVNVSGTLVEQALFNVVDNAIRYSAKNSKVHIVALYENGQVTVAVTNQGDMIAESQKDKIFTLFYSNNRDSGSGLGLSVAKGIVNAHGGDIDVHSSPNGNVFRITLPVRQPDLLSGKGAVPDVGHHSAQGSDLK